MHRYSISVDRIAGGLAVAAIAVALPALSSGTAEARTPPSGGLDQLSGPAGCVTSPGGGCLADPPMRAPAALAVSPDGGNVYAIGNLSFNLLAFDRSAASGVLQPVPPPAGCFAASASPACTTARGTAWGFDLLVSPDGRDVYSSAGFARQIGVFRREPIGGLLSQPPGSPGCVQATGGRDVAPPAESGCNRVRNLAYPRGMAISGDGIFLYVATFAGKGIVVLRRDPASGALSELPGNCVAVRGRGGCSRAVGLTGATDVALSPDGRFLYATGYGDNAIAAFARDGATGRLTQLAGSSGCAGGSPPCAAARGIGGPFKLAVSPDGRNLYLASRKARSLAVFARNAASGSLTQLPGRAACVSGRIASGCRQARGLDGARGVTVAPNGRTVYAASFTDSAVTAFARRPGGSLKQLRGRAGCLAARRLKGCGRARAIVGAGDVVASPDGRSLYTGSWRNSPAGIGVFSLRR